MLIVDIYTIFIDQKYQLELINAMLEGGATIHTASMPCVSSSPFTMHKVCQLNVLRSVTKTVIHVYVTSTLQSALQLERGHAVGKFM